jgi:cytoskeletal protein CcmA (bactofilin family)
MIKNILIQSSVSLLTAALLLSPNAAGDGTSHSTALLTSDLSPHMSPPIFNSAIFAQGYVTLSADAWVDGNIFAGAATTVGANADVYGNIVAGAATTLGANANVVGTIDSGAATTLGAGVWVLEGDVYSAAATTLGANSVVQGRVQSAAATTIGSGAVIYGYNNADALPLSLTPDATWIIQDPLEFWNNTYSAPDVGDLVHAQDYLYNLDRSPEDTSNPPNMSSGLTHNIGADESWLPGVYRIDGSLSVSAAVTITLDNSNTSSDNIFIINVRDYVSFGALAKVKLAESTHPATVIWNVKGTYISTGAGAEIEGKLLANTYIATGAKSKARKGAYSATSYVFVGAKAEIGPTPRPTE